MEVLLCAGVCRNAFIGVCVYILMYVLSKHISAIEVGVLSPSTRFHGGKRSPAKHIRKLLVVVTGRAHSCWAAQCRVHKGLAVGYFA